MIAPNKILTAAHCVSALFGLRHRLTVDLGMHNLQTGDAQVTKKVRRIKIFWGFNFRSKVSIAYCNPIHIIIKGFSTLLV